MTYLRGIDVSKWQGTTPSLAGLTFLFARASIGTARDEKYTQHIRNARAAGLYVGAYHFNWDTLSVAAQVDAFLAAAGDVDFYALDVEGANAFNLTQTREFTRRMHDKGKKVGLYMSEGAFFTTGGQDWNWVANWSREPAKDWSFWQYRGSPLDLDYFAGTRADLARLAGRSVPTAPDSSTEPDPQEPPVNYSDPTPVLIDLPLGAQLVDHNGNDLTRVSASGVKRGVVSPFGVAFNANANYRAAFIVTGGEHVVAFIHNPDANIRPIPATVCPPEIDCGPLIDGAIAPFQDQITALNNQVAYLQNEATDLRGDIADAASVERERIAGAVGAAEATRIRSI